MGTGFLRLPSIDRRRGCRRHVLCGRRCCDARARLVRRRLLFAIVVACRAARCVGRRRVVASAALLLLLLLLHVSDACACACYCSVRATDPLTRQARAGADDDAHERRFFPLAAWRRVASAWRWSPRCVVCERQAARHRAATRDVRGGGGAIRAAGGLRVLALECATRAPPASLPILRRVCSCVPRVRER